MAKQQKIRKTLWRDIGDLRRPNSTWRVRRAARWWARTLGLPDDAVVLLNPDGRRARANKTLRSLKRDWGV